MMQAIVYGFSDSISPSNPQPKQPSSAAKWATKLTNVLPQTGIKIGSVWEILSSVIQFYVLLKEIEI